MSEQDANQPEAGAAPDAMPTIVRRGHAATRLLPRAEEPESSTVVVHRSVLARRSSDKPKTSRERKIAGDLPEWEPLPPGELVVNRSRRA
jgi:hypothetical protein